MSVPVLRLISKQSDGNQPKQNDFGETPLAYAPTIRLSNGEDAVPQQYLDVERTLSNLSNVLAHISVPKGYQLFAGQEGSCMYIIVGVVGKENYPPNADVAKLDKMVYGRRWLIEPTTPTSEIVQTSLLAVQKVREHEVRELFSVRTPNDSGLTKVFQAAHITTPFNCHLDLPLMAGNRSLLSRDQSAPVLDVAAQLKGLKFADYTFELQNQTLFAGKSVFELKILGHSEHFPELQNESISVICEQPNDHDFLHQLITVLIAKSDRYVEENFSFKSFKRFSHDLDPIELAKFSYQTRNVKVTDKRFDKGFKDMSYKVDASKAPSYNGGELGRQQRQLVSSFDDLGGYLPLDD